MMRKAEVLMLVLALTLDGHVHSGRIYGGHEVLPHGRPYMVLLQSKMDNGSKFFCGGIILNEDFVMTAAHCKADSYKVLLGFHKFSENCMQVSVEKAFPRKDFNETDCMNDIMLLKLSSKVNISSNVGFIDLPSEDAKSLPTSCSISGWGTTIRGKTTMSLMLMEANVTLTEDCLKKKSYCSEGEVGPGQGDSGGPLVCEDGKVYGIVSSSVTTPTGDHIYSYAKIPDFKEWIDGVMEGHGKP